MRLDSVAPLSAEVGYGEVGRLGQLGYENRTVIVHGQPRPHALSTHPPARITFELGGRWRHFRTLVALNDDVAPHASYAHFQVLADGQPVGSATHVRSGEPPRLLVADLGPARHLELIVSTDRWAYCHAVWIDPELLEESFPEAEHFGSLFLDCLEPDFSQVGFGHLGRRGSLGYEDKQVSVRGRTYDRTLSTHAPSLLRYALGGRFTSFRTQVALNDDVPAGATHAHFSVRADGHQVALANFVTPGAEPRSLSANVAGVHVLELAVSTPRWEHCHAVWLDPLVENSTPSVTVEQEQPWLVDCLGRAAIRLPDPPPRAERCVATVVSPGFEKLLEDLLGSLRANGQLQDCLLVLFAVRPTDECRRIAAKYNATLIQCEERAVVNATLKALLYSAARVVDADYFLCFDADMLVLRDLRSIFAVLEAAPEGSILACREGNGAAYSSLEHALVTVYRGHRHDIAGLLGRPGNEGTYDLVVNDGLFAAGRTGMLTLDGLLRTWTSAAAWVDARRDVWWRNQLVFNLALAHLGCGVELDPLFNVQLNSQEVAMHETAGQVEALWRGRKARVLHFNGLGRAKYPPFRNLFAAVPDPLPQHGGGDAYEAFLAVLRTWVGRLGRKALAWSFYGTADADSAEVRDVSTFPLLAALHYLVRANGCVRALETGTARGVSAACLASAVCHRPGGKVVTFDPQDYPERNALWAALPREMRSCIDMRSEDSLSGMASALEAGERFELALLDSIHAADHVWDEFQLARELVCPGGLILIHDVCLEGATVADAVARIAESGFGVIRLWSAAMSGVFEDDHLGLAVIENTHRALQDSVA